MASLENGNTLDGKIVLSDSGSMNSSHPHQIMLVGPDGMVIPAVIDETGVVRKLDQPTEPENVSAADDILQQALQEAGSDLIDETNVIENGNGEEEMDTDQVQTVQLTTEDGQVLNSVIESTFTGDDGNEYAIIKSETDGSTQIVMIRQADTDEQIENNVVETGEDTQQTIQISENGETETSVIYNPDDELVASAEVDPPLGSSENPIRIIQQGNQYTSLQQLTPEQLQHIVQVLQQQQASKPAQKQGTTTLYSPQTNTKIIYRVIYPGEKKSMLMNAGHKIPISGVRTGFRGRGRGRGKVMTGAVRGRGRPRKYPLGDEDIDPTTFPELSREEKEKKKKMRPRTRSGRVSKPPKHMVKDYKQIHLVDWAEDYDDDDGGYSDFKESEEDDDGSVPDGEMDGDEVTKGPDGVKPKKFSCPVCGKCYYSPANLDRHFRLVPEHGTPSGDYNTVPNGGNDESNSSSASQSLPTAQQRVFRRGKLPTRLSNLREIIKQFTNEELMEIVLPRLTQCLSTFEYMLMKSERHEPGGTTLKPSVHELLKDYDQLLKDVKNYGSSRLTLLQHEPADKNGAVKVDDVIVASSLGLSARAWYQVQHDDTPYIPMKYKYSKAAYTFKEKMNSLFESSTDEPPAKRVRFSTISPDKSKQGTSVISVTPKMMSTKPALHNQPYSAGITLRPELMTGEGAGDAGRIIVQRADDGQDDGVEPVPVAILESSSGSINISDLISMSRAGDDVTSGAGDSSTITIDARAGVSEAQNSALTIDSITPAISHSPDAMLQPTPEVTRTESETVTSVVSETLTSPGDQKVEENDSGNVVPESNESGNGEPEPEAEGNVVIMQTDDGMLLIQKPDGTTLQIQHSGDSIPMETVQYLLSMDTSNLQQQQQDTISTMTASVDASQHSTDTGNNNEQHQSDTVIIEPQQLTSDST